MNRLLIFFLIIIFLLVMVAGALLLRGPAEPVEPTATEEVAATDEVPAVTATFSTDDNETTESTGATATPEFVSIAEGFSITPAQAQIYTEESDTFPDALGPPEVGQQWILLSVSFLNEAVEEPVPVAADEITLFDDENNTYSPLEDGGTISPYLVGAELLPDESLRGFVAFSIPEDVSPAVLQWCPNGNCEMALRADILLPVTE